MVFYKFYLLLNFRYEKKRKSRKLYLVQMITKLTKKMRFNLLLRRNLHFMEYFCWIFLFVVFFQNFDCMGSFHNFL